jgi:uroporphyrinogen decarboxylase
MMARGTNMLPRERVYATLDHTEPDRIPWGEHLIDFNIYEEILGRKTYVNSHFFQEKAMWDGARDEIVAHYRRDLPDLAEALELDIVTLPGPFPEKGEVVESMEQVDETTYRNEKGDIYRVSGGCWLLPYEMNPEVYVEPTIDSLEAEIEEIDNNPYDVSTSAWEVHRFIIEKLKPTHFIAALGGGLEFPRFGCTVSDEWISLIEKPEVCRKLQEKNLRSSIRLIKAYAELGLDGIIPCGDLGNSQNLSAHPDVYRDMVYPAQEEQAKEAHRRGLKILLHCCGHTWPIVHHLADVYDAYEAIQTSAGMDICELKTKIGEQTTLWGGIMHEHLSGGTEDDIRDDARYSFGCAAPGGGFIMGSSHSLAVGAKIENVLQMKRVRDEWGEYPVNPATFR